MKEILDSVILFFVVQQSFGGYLIAAVAVVGAETRQLRKKHQKSVGVLKSLKLQANITYWG